MSTDTPLNCALCGRCENEIPLTVWQYQRQALPVCPTCMPAFIHHTEEALAQWQARQHQPAEGDHAAR